MYFSDVILRAHFRVNPTRFAVVLRRSVQVGLLPGRTKKTARSHLKQRSRSKKFRGAHARGERFLVFLVFLRVCALWWLREAEVARLMRPPLPHALPSSGVRYERGCTA